MNEIIRPGVALFTITLIAAVILGAVQAITAEPIRIQEEETRQAAMREVLPEAVEFKSEIPLPEGGGDMNGSIESVSTGYAADGSVVGYVIGAESKGYSGSVHVLVSVVSDGTVGAIEVVDHSETPGLGANSTNPEFSDQYKGLTEGIDVVKVAPGENEIQAITSATITSNSVTTSVNNALSFFNQSIKGVQQ